MTITYYMCDLLHPWFQYVHVCMWKRWSEERRESTCKEKGERERGREGGQKEAERVYVSR